MRNSVDTLAMKLSLTAGAREYLRLQLRITILCFRVSRLPVVLFLQRNGEVRIDQDFSNEVCPNSRNLHSCRALPSAALKGHMGRELLFALSFIHYPATYIF